MTDKLLVSQYDGLNVRAAGRMVRVDKGGQLPADADPEHVKVLVARRLVAEGEITGGIAHDQDAPPPFKLTAEQEQTRAASRGGYDGTAAPPKSGSHADWVDWARKVEGVTADSELGTALAGRKRDELADAYADRTPAQS